MEEAAVVSFPQMDAATFAPQLVWLAITFVVLYFVMARVVVPRITGILETRDAKVASDLGAAGAMKAQADTALANYERLSAQARATAQQLAAEARAAANAKQAAELEALDGRLAATGRKAEADVAAARAKAMEGLRDLAAEIAQATAEKLVGTKLNRDAAAKAVDAELKAGK